MGRLPSPARESRYERNTLALSAWGTSTAPPSAPATSHIFESRRSAERRGSSATRLSIMDPSVFMVRGFCHNLPQAESRVVYFLYIGPSRPPHPYKPPPKNNKTKEIKPCECS